MGTLSGQRMASAWARGDLASLVWGGMALLWEGTGERPQGRVDSEDSWAWVLPPPHTDWKERSCPAWPRLPAGGVPTQPVLPLLGSQTVFPFQKGLVVKD